MSYRNVKDFGAIGDGKAKDTAAIQAALDAGGMVTLPPGIYLSGSLYLRSNGGLEIQAGATLLASPDLSDYNAADFVPQNSKSISEVTSGGHLINAVECENIVLCGFGTIDGNGGAFLNKPLENPPHMFERTMRPAQMIFLCECRGIHVQDLTLRNSPYWTCFLYGCQEATVQTLHIHSHAKMLNDDGIDIDCCQQVTISDCIIDTGDDCITLRGNDAKLKVKRPCEYVTVSNCILTSRYANAIRVGVGNGIIRKALMQNIIITGYRTGICIVSNWSNNPKSCVGVDISDIDFSNIRTYARRPFNIKLDNSSSSDARTSATIRNITIRNMNGTCELTGNIKGNGLGILKDVTFENVSLTCIGKGFHPEHDFKGAWGHSSTDAVFEANDAENLTFRNVKIDYAPEASGWTSGLRTANATVNLENTNLKCD